MDRLQLFQTFIASIDKGSLSGAAKVLNISQPAVSQQITLLESILQKELLFRTSRGVKPTEAGLVVYNNAQNILEQVTKLHEELKNLDESLTGPLRITAPLAIGQSLVAPIVFELQSQYPELDISLKLSDQLADLVKDGIDLAVRVGSLGKSDAMARKIGDLELMLAATPDFLNRYGRPKQPEDLVKIPMIQYRDEKKVGKQIVQKDGREYQADIQSNYTFDNPDVIINALKRGIGYTKLPYLLIKDQLNDGTLEKVLPDYTVPPKPIYLLYPSRQSLTRRAEVFIDRILSTIINLDGITPARGGKWRIDADQPSEKLLNIM
ncbi:LysR family transcriptional regulator [Kiloniella litopenaei]|uniref:LysR family transcriptional regulator n=1 Tax=Kiloniella litopenaei TaxID=1549748 RepID=UPI0006987210|nr:LysR family transcriptional regulator [Kiloniella litopenaei]